MGKELSWKFWINFLVHDFFLIAKIRAPLGKHGFVRIVLYTDFPERFFKLHHVYLDFFGDKKIFYIEAVVKKKGFIGIKFKNFDNQKDIQVLLGKEIFIDEQNLIKLRNNQYFHHDIIGSRIFKDNIFIGVLKEILSSPANDIFVIDVEGKEILIPAVKEFIDRFEPAEKKLFLKPDADINYDED